MNKSKLTNKQVLDSYKAANPKNIPTVFINLSGIENNVTCYFSGN